MYLKAQREITKNSTKENLARTFFTIAYRRMYVPGYCSTCFLHVPKELFCGCEGTRSGPTESAAYVSEALICGKNCLAYVSEALICGKCEF